MNHFYFIFFLLSLSTSKLGLGYGFEFDLDTNSNKLNLARINSQNVYHTKSVNESGKWLVFPLQLDYHNYFIQAKSFLLEKNFMKKNQFKSIDSALIIKHEDNSFWKTYNQYLNLHNYVEMKLTKETIRRTSSMKVKVYEQYIYGFKVFGGDYKVTIGAHDGITHIHGHSFPTIDQSYAYIQSNHMSKLAIKTLKVEELLKIFKSYYHALRKTNDDSSEHPFSILSNQGKEQVENKMFDNDDLVALGPYEMLWYENPSSKLILVYHLEVHNVQSNHDLMDVYFDYHSLQVVSSIINKKRLTYDSSNVKGLGDDTTSVNYYHTAESNNVPKQQTTKDQSSPFTSKSSFTSEIIIYKGAQNNLIFNSSSSNSSLNNFPTNNDEINMLVDVTLYVKNLIYCLSDGVFLTWQMIQRVLEIGYNLPGDNASFDPVEERIIFSTGFIAVDVIAHEWFHGYIRTTSGLIYRYQSGAMNEAFADIIGETVDILTRKDPILNQKRHVQPSSCIENLPGQATTTKGTDQGVRWIIGETTAVVRRDMYKPECYNQPGYFHSPYYVCSVTDIDNGGVHYNSGVMNHFYAVMVDGGIIRSGVKPVKGLGFLKALNIFLGAAVELTSLSQFNDFAVALSLNCNQMIGKPLNNLNYLDNVITSTTTKSDLITSDDCHMVDTLIKQSQINLKSPICPNLVCGDSVTDCELFRCRSNYIDKSHEDYVKNDIYSLKPICSDYLNQKQSIARVFNQTALGLNGKSEFYLSCIEFLLKDNKGFNDITIDVYIDKTGGIPDIESFQLVKSFEIKTPNVNQIQRLYTVSDELSSRIFFKDEIETLVVIMHFTPTIDRSIGPQGYFNNDLTNLLLAGKFNEIPVTLFSFVSGPCKNGKYSTLIGNYYNELTNDAVAQWYVKVTGSSTPHYSSSNNNDDDGISNKDLTGIAIGVFFFGLLLGFICVYIAFRLLYIRHSTNASSSESYSDTINNHKSTDTALFSTVNQQEDNEIIMVQTRDNSI